MKVRDNEIVNVLLNGGIVENGYRYYKYVDGTVYFVDYDRNKKWKKYGEKESLNDLGKYGVWNIIHT